MAPTDLDVEAAEEVAPPGDDVDPASAETEREPSRARASRPNWVPAALYALLAGAFLWPVPLRPNTTVYGYGGDGYGYIYDLAVGRTNPLLFWRARDVDQLGFPDGFVESNWVRVNTALPDAIAWPMSKVVGSVATYNAVIFLGLVLSALAACWLFTYTTGSRRVGFWGGLAFALFPWLQLAATAWPSFTHVYWLPLAVLASFHYRDAPSARRLALVAGVLGLSAITNGYVAFFTLIVLLACSVIWGPPLVGQLRDLSAEARRRVLVVGVVAAGVVMAVGVAAVAVLRGSVERDSSELDTYALRLPELFRPTSLQFFSSDWIVPISPGSLHGSNNVEISQFVGWSTIVLALIGLLSPRSGARAGRQRLLSLVGVALGLAFAMSNQVVFGFIPAPARVIHDAVPFFRVYSRFGLVIFLFLLLLAAHGVAVLVAGRSSRSRTLIVGALCVVTFAELWAPLPGRSNDVERPAFAAAIDGDTQPVVAFYPLVRSDDGYFYQQEIWSLYLPGGTALVNGGPTDSPGEGLRDQLKSLNSAETWDGLDALGVEYVVLDKASYERIHGHAVTTREGAIYEDDGFVVYRLDAEPDGAVAWTAGDQFPAEVREDGPSWRWIRDGTHVHVRADDDVCVEVTGAIVAIDGETGLTITTESTSTQVLRDDDGDDRFSFVVDVGAGTTVFDLDPDREPSQLTDTDLRIATVYLSDLTVDELEPAACGR